MKKVLNIYLTLGLITLASLVLFSCNEDKGNYDYQETGGVEIGGLGVDSDTTLYAEIGAQLIIKPALKFTNGGSENDFLFEWYLNNELLLEGSKDFDLIIGGSLGKVGDHSMRYIITNKVTGVKTIKVFTIRVASRIGKGYVAITEKEDGFDLDMIALYNDSLFFVPNILKTVDSDLPRTGNPIDIVMYKDNNCSPTPYIKDGKNYALWVLSDQATNKLGPAQYKYIPEYNISSLIQPATSLASKSNVVASKMVNVNNGTGSQIKTFMYVEEERSWYLNSFFSSMLLFERPVNTMRENDWYAKTSFKAAPYLIAANSRGAILFDEDANVFKYNPHAHGYNSWNNVTCVPLADGGEDDLKFKFNDTNQRLVYMGPAGNSVLGGLGFAIVRNVSTEKYRYLEMNFSSSTATKEFGAELKDSNSMLSSLKYYARHPEYSLLYAATDDKLYVMIIDAAGMTFKDITSQCVKSGHKISFIKFMRNGVKFDGKLNYLAVGTYDPNGTTGENGTLAFYNVNRDNGALSIQKYPQEPKNGYQIDMIWSGFGKISGVDYKEVE